MRQNNNSRELLEMPLYPSAKQTFVVGDTVRSYRSGFDEVFPYKNNYLEGVVIAIESWTKPNDYLKVKWIIKKHFNEYFPVSVFGGKDTFTISISSPHLVKINKLQLAL